MDTRPSATNTPSRCRVHVRHRDCHDQQHCIAWALEHAPGLPGATPTWVLGTMRGCTLPFVAGLFQAGNRARCPPSAAIKHTTTHSHVHAQAPSWARKLIGFGVCAQFGSQEELVYLYRKAAQHPFPRPSLVSFVHEFPSPSHNIHPVITDRSLHHPSVKFLLYLKTLPSAYLYSLPSIVMLGGSSAHCCSTNWRSSGFVGSSLVNS